jgi:hypothetical protein
MAHLVWYQTSVPNGMYLCTTGQLACCFQWHPVSMCACGLCLYENVLVLALLIEQQGGRSYSMWLS